MKGNFVERPNELMALNEIEWQTTKNLTDEDGMTWSCLPVGSEAQMFHSASCRVGCGRPAHWVGVGTPFEDGQEYLLSSEAWCYWHFPNHYLTEEELPLIRQADWARQQTVDEIAEIVENAYFGVNDDTAEVLRDLASTIRTIVKTRKEHLSAWVR